MKKRVTVISNVVIVCVLVGLGVAVFTTDLSNVFLSVGAPVYNGSRDGDKVSLMFVVEDDARYLPEIMDLLKDKGVPATFFVGGRWAGLNQATAKQIAEDFEIANHGYNNRSLAKLKESEQHKEIQNCHSMVYTITSSSQLDVDESGQVQGGVESKAGVAMKLFSPPNGSFNKTTLKSAERLGYRTVMWSKDATAGDIFTKATADVRSGDLVRLKPSLSAYSQLLGILTEYGRKGFNIVKVSENILA